MRRRPCASTRPAACATSPIWRRRRTSSACAIAALDSLLEGADGDPPLVVASAVALMERVPDPELRPHGFAIEVGETLDLDETLARLVAGGYEREEQVFERGQFAVRGGILDIYPATEERAVRVELFGDEVESLRWFSTFTQRSLADAQRVEIAPAAELGPEYRELAEMAAEEESEQRPDVAEVLPVDRFRSFLDLVPDEATVVVAAEEELRPALADHWQDVTTSLHSDDAHDLYLPPDEVGQVTSARERDVLRGVRGPAAPVPRTGGRHRGAHDQRGGAGAGEARALRLRGGRRLGPARRGRTRRLQPRAPAAAVRRRPRARSARDCGSRRRGCARDSSRRSSRPP